MSPKKGRKKNSELNKLIKTGEILKLHVKIKCCITIYSGIILLSDERLKKLKYNIYFSL